MPSFYDACLYFDGNIDSMKTLIENNHNVWNLGFYGACYGGHLKLVQLFISMDEKATDLNRGLGGACNEGHLEIIQFLITKGANDWNLGAYNACRGGHLKILEFLISTAQENEKKNIANGIQANNSKLEWSNLFIAASFSDNMEIVHFLISKAEYAKNILSKIYQWPIHKSKITILLYLNTSLNVFQSILGFSELKTLVDTTRQSIRTTNVLLPDLLDIVAKCIII